jgi:CRISPR/Cas system endoribonuclease Cas6 (RAMP superfamily)
MQKSFTVNQSADDLYLRIISVGNTERLLLDDFELTGYTLGFENWHQSVSIYPNPTQIKTVYFQGMPGSKEVMIYSLHGKQLLHKTVNEHLNVESLVPGLYVAKVHVQQQIFTEKLVVR